MRNFRRLNLLPDISGVLAALTRAPELWELDTFWKTYPIPIFGEVDTIYLRFPDKRVFTTGAGDILACTDQPALALLPEAQILIDALMQYVHGAQLGRVLINRLLPGARVLPHSDGKGLYYARYHIVIDSNEVVRFRCGDEYAQMRQSEAWWFNNSEEHEVINEGATPRIHLVADIRHE